VTVSHCLSVSCCVLGPTLATRSPLAHIDRPQSQRRAANVMQGARRVKQAKDAAKKSKLARVRSIGAFGGSPNFSRSNCGGGGGGGGDDGERRASAPTLGSSALSIGTRRVTAVQHIAVTAQRTEEPKRSATSDAHSPTFVHLATSPTRFRDPDSGARAMRAALRNTWRDAEATEALIAKRLLRSTSRGLRTGFGSSRGQGCGFGSSSSRDLLRRVPVPAVCDKKAAARPSMHRGQHEGCGAGCFRLPEAREVVPLGAYELQQPARAHVPPATAVGLPRILHTGFAVRSSAAPPHLRRRRHESLGDGGSCTL
jgi:hypothetical protein